MEEKTGTVAKRLNIHANTVRNYADRYAEFLSVNATSRKRTFNADDLLTLSTIAEFRDRGMEWDDIHVALEQGQRVESVPELATPEVEAARKALDLVPKPHVDRLQERINQLERERDTLEERLANALVEVQKQQIETQAEHEQELSDIREAWQKEVSEIRDNLQSEVTTLKDKISTIERERGLLEGQLKIIEQERKPASYWLAIIAGVTVAVIVIAAVVVVYLSSGVG